MVSRALEARPFATLDCETDPFRAGRHPWPFAWGLYTGSSYSHWWGRGREGEVVQALGKLPQGTIVYAHNAGRFDLHFLLPWIDPMEELFLIHGRIVRCTLRGGVECRDSFPLIPEALDAYKKTPIDYSLMESEVREQHRAEILNYLRDDCVNLYELVEAFRAEHGDALTLPQGALRKWREIQDVPRPRVSPQFDATIRPYYYGGRCQSFARGIERRPFQVWDINSAYPRAMLEEHPYGSDYITLRSLPPARALARSFVRVRARSYGALPLRAPDGSLSFPTDDVVREYHATGHEIAAGLETGTLRIDRVESASVFTETIHFRAFIEHYWERRKAAKRRGDVLENLVCKRSMNSLYGKLAQNPRRRRSHRIADAEGARRLMDDGWRIAGMLGPWWLCDRERDDTWGYLSVHTAASITGWVRARLLRALCAVDDPLYCDTDSIACRRFPDSLPQGSGLGEWELESDCQMGGFAGKKLYAWRLGNGDWKVASKGVRLSAQEILKICRGKTIEYVPDAPTFRTFGEPVFVRRKVQRTGAKTCPPKARKRGAISRGS